MTQELEYDCAECTLIQQRFCNAYGKPSQCMKRDGEPQPRAKPNRNRPYTMWGKPR